MGAGNSGTNGTSAVRPAVAAAKGTVAFLMTGLPIVLIVSLSRLAWTDLFVQYIWGILHFAAFPSDLWDLIGDNVVQSMCCPIFL